MGVGAMTAGATVLIAGVAVGTVAGLTGSAILMGAAVAYSASQSAKARSALGSASVDQGRTVMARDAIGPRRLIYGQTLVSGNIVFMHVTGAKNQYLHLVVVVAGHEVEELGDIYFNDELIPISGNASTGRTVGYVRINKKRGVAGDVADADLVAETGGLWTSAHKLSGCAYLVARLQWSADIFPNGIPAVKCVVKGKKVYDPRSGLTAYSANSALCAADYLKDSTWGKGVTQARIRSADLGEAANICDEWVTLDDATTERRYETHGTIDANQSPSSILTDLAGAMAGCIVDTGGTWTVRAGAHRTSTVTLTDGDLVGGFSVQPRQSRQDTFNRIRGVYVSPDNQWAPADLPALSNATYKASDGGVWLDRDVQLNFTSSSATGQRLLKIELERGRQQISCSGVYSLKAMQLMPGDTVAITRASLGWSAKLFSVVGWTFALMGENENIAVGVSLELQETAAGVWDWANGEETTEDLAPNTTLPTPFTVGTPTLTLLTDTTTVNLQPDGTIQPRLKISWATPNNIHVESGGVVEIEYKKSTDGDYSVWGESRGDILFDFLTDVKIGVAYNIRARFRNNVGVRGSYGTATSAAIVGDTVAPNDSTAFTATAQPGFIDLFWYPSASNTVNEYQIQRSITSASAGFGFIADTANNQFQDSAVVAGTTYWYKLFAVSASEILSTPGLVANTGTGVVALIAPNGALPSLPTAPAQPATPVVGTYDASDGSVYAFVTLELAALPSGAKVQNLKYRRTGATEWLLAGQYKNTAALTVALGTAIRLDDLSPGVGYDIATQAFNSTGGSAEVTGTAFTAATKTTKPGTVNLSGSLETNEKSPPIFLSGVRRYGMRWLWADSSGSSYTYPADFAYWEVKATETDDDAATNYNADSGQGSPKLYRTVASWFDFYVTTPVDTYKRVRPVNKSGVAGDWSAIGGWAASLWARPGGSMMQQNATAVAVTGITQGAGSLQRQVVARQPVYKQINLTGGAASETYSLDISNSGFSAAPDVGWFQSADQGGMLIRYDYDSSNSTVAELRITMADGSNVPTWTNMEITGELAEYT